MKLEAAKAIAECITDSELSADYIIPNAFNERVASAVAAAVMRCAREEKVCKEVRTGDYEFKKAVMGV